MNVTKTEAKCSQLQIDFSQNEGSMQTNSADHEGYAGAHSSGRITENNITDADMSKDRLLEKIVDRDNMNNAYKRVKSNKGLSHWESKFRKHGNTQTQERATGEHPIALSYLNP